MIWSVDCAKDVRDCEVIVSADSEQYAEIAREAGAGVIMRPPEVCSDTATDQDVMAHLLSGRDCDLIVYLRPTTPFRGPHIIDEAIRIMEVDPEITGLRSVEEMGESAFKTFQIVDGLLLGTEYADQPNQLCPRTYRGNGYVDIARAEIVRQGLLWGPRVRAYITPRVIEIDTEEDLAYADYWLRSRRIRYGGSA